MGGPTGAELGLAHVQLDDPTFLAWARRQGKPINRSTPSSELGELLAQYEYELREQQRRQDEITRRAAEETLRARGVLARTSALQPFHARRAAERDDQRLREKIRAGWCSGNPSLKSEAEAAVNGAIPLKRWVYHSHGADRDKDRWSYMRHYLHAFHRAFGSGPPGEEQLLEEVLREEKIYLAEMNRREEQLARARSPALQLEALRAWARKQPLNPADAFEPGIAYYDIATAESKPEWVDKDVKEVSQDDDVTTISYTTGKSLSFPSSSLDFEGKYNNFVVDTFTRRHKPTGRLVPFVLYDRSVDLYRELPEMDALSSKDRVLMALPYMLTAAVTAFYSRDPWLVTANGILKVLNLLAWRKAVSVGAPVAATTLSSTYQLGVRGALLTRSVAAEVTFAVRTFGFSAQAGAYLGRSAYTYYLTNAVAVNTNIVVGADIALAVAGQDMGPISPGDVLNMAVHADDASRAGAKAWKAIQAEVVEVDANTGKAIIRVSSVDSIADDVVRARYDMGKKVTGDTKGASRAGRAVDDPATKGRLAKASAADVKKPAAPVIPLGQAAKGKGKVKPPPDPRKALPIGELEAAMKQLVNGLSRLGVKYDPKALEKITNISADAIRESGIRPSDLAKLANSLSRAGATTRRFVNEFYDVPGFERVLLGWAKRHYWNTKLAKPAWTKTKAFYTGTSYVMKYATRKLDPKHVRFEWPVSINDTKWGDEVFARYVDIVVSGGRMVKPGRLIQLELKSWTEFVLRMKTNFAPGKATSYPGTVGYQLLRDTALFEPANIRWVFDGSKVTEDKVIAAFERIIADDPYLRAQWGGKDADPAKIRELLDRVIEVF